MTLRNLGLRDVQVEFSRLNEDVVAARRALSKEIALNTEYRMVGGGGTVAAASNSAVDCGSLPLIPANVEGLSVTDFGGI